MRVHIRHESFRLSRPGGRWEESKAEVAIVGLGLIGGSIGLGLQDFGYQVGGYDVDPQVLETAIERDAVNGIFDNLEEVVEADTIFIAVPPAHVLPILREIKPFLRPETVVTDCASVKADIVEAVHAEFPELAPRFVGGHPMAGKHVGGIQNAAWNLFENAAWVLTPDAGTDRQAVSRINQLVCGLGAQVYHMAPDEHDRHVALLSHVPHILAAQLVQTSQGLAYPQVAGGSWRDLTRVAGSDPALWTQIVMNNRAAIADSLRALADELAGFAILVEDGDKENVEWFFNAARESKRRQRED
ncbi:MAG: prephenate dehydrogenase [Fimbriimonas sp.]